MTNNEYIDISKELKLDDYLSKNNFQKYTSRSNVDLEIKWIKHLMNQHLFPKRSLVLVPAEPRDGSETVDTYKARWDDYKLSPDNFTNLIMASEDDLEQKMTALREKGEQFLTIPTTKDRENLIFEIYLR
ncbi:MAG: hypothetical protein ABIC91_07775 [Nanoarchaeota archaeon]|nr:hypothetical protein [Nanoarchaeota archaeon]MBU1031250.1 hypothetical protein [Nanoarchaeota archaeon]MBU1849591.1 hypothetical protein [Nanoarchaeota archaeon]